MLLPRIITALVLIPATIAVLYYLPPLPFFIVTGVITLYGAWEWAGLMGFNKGLHKTAYVLFTLFSAVALLMIINRSLDNCITFLMTTFLWWLLAFLLVVFYPRYSEIWGKSTLIRGVMGLFVLLPFWWSINFIRGDNTPDRFIALLFLLVLIWGADSAAYFTGRKWGKHKLAPAVSPGKTWEGLMGALFSTIVIPIIVFALCKLPLNLWLPGILLSIITIFFSIVGDLFESMVKRKVNIKDSGKLLPGHGGLLDRIDSLTAATPVFTLGAWFITSYYS